MTVIQPKFTVQMTAEGVAAATAETLLQVVAPAARPIEVIRWGISFNGTSPTAAPVRVELLRFTSAGSSSAFVPRKVDPRSNVATATALTAFTAEPVADDVLETYFLTPNGGLLVLQYAPDERIVVAQGGRLGLRVLGNDAVNVSAYMVFAE